MENFPLLKQNVKNNNNDISLKKYKPEFFGFFYAIIFNLGIILSLFLWMQYTEILETGGNNVVFSKIPSSKSLYWYNNNVYIDGFQSWYNTNVYVYHYHKALSYYNNSDISFTIGIDGISIAFLLLTSIIMSLCAFASIGQTRNYNSFIFCLLLIEIFLFLSFIVTDLFFFYIFFESVLIPMFIIIGYWGTRDRKIRAAYYFFIYTLFGSLFMLFGILYVHSLLGTTNFETLFSSCFTFHEQLKLWICFFIPFAIKIPMFPFHIWLPEAHVEAPTIGSVILASLLLKLGSYGFLRFTIPFFPLGSWFYSPLVYSLAIVSVVYASLVTIRQIDLKRIIAYSSVAHMNLIVLGLFSATQEGIDGAIYLMIGHGIVSSGLFFCVGVLYDRYQTRVLFYYGGLASVMPKLSFFLFLFSLANMGFPGTSNFVGELLILVGIFENNSAIMIFAASGIVFSAIYSIWLFNRVAFGALKLKYFKLAKNKTDFPDMSKKEDIILFFLTFGMLLLGVYSSIITDLTSLPIKRLLTLFDL